MLVGLHHSEPLSVAPSLKRKPSLWIARISMQRAFLVWLGSVYQFLFASLGSCCGVHHSPQYPPGWGGASALAALAHGAVGGAAAISRLFIGASSGSDGIVILSCGSGIVIPRCTRRPCRRSRAPSYPPPRLRA